MLAVKSIIEDSYGAKPECDDSMQCDICGSEIIYEEPYIEKWDGKIMCADCIEKEGFEKALAFVGHDSIFDLLEKLRELHYR
jgi:hypothetical protein